MDQQRTLIGLGELLWDYFPDGRRPGGAPANVAYHAQQLGLRGLALSRVGTDHEGEKLVQHLARHGLSTEFIQRDAGHRTGTVTVDTSHPDHPRFTIHENVAWDFMQLDDAWRKALASADAVCFGSLAQRSTESRNTIQNSLDLARDALIVCDINLRPPFYERQTVEASLKRADVIKLNEHEAPAIADMLGLDESGELRDIGRRLVGDTAARIVCITQGAEGCLAISAEECIDVPGRKVEVADAVGSGDAFTAAFTYGLLQSWPLRISAEFANQVGGLVASRAGAMPDVQEEYTRLKAGANSA
jgi:fructokinase